MIFGNTQGTLNKANNLRPEMPISPKDNLKIEISENRRRQQYIIKKGNKYYLHYEGLLFDEEINDLIGNLASLSQKYAVALVGKIIQTNLLNETD